ncbi:MAG: helix-turn-helix transcriptional regulator [Clostridiales Family XIII bacterium]|jgi:DNA-binding XRE family transcriptional regulator|nr:helix-turn-helix transcriptional regulator [Clostridiales Family XIII bacterium]
MMRAYDESYAGGAAVTLGDLFDYAVNDCNCDAELFYQMFITTGTADKFERGDPAYLVGKGGIEIALDILSEAAGRRNFPMPQFRQDKAPEYWAGWALAHYQWYTARSFSDIRSFFPISDIIDSYHPLHEADIAVFYEVAETRAGRDLTTNLKRRRTIAGMSQSQLARAAQVQIRSIQMYEQRNKNINAAKAITVAKLARALSCGMADLLEYGR